jgi:hypothetical protein
MKGSEVKIEVDISLSGEDIFPLSSQAFPPPNG